MNSSASFSSMVPAATTVPLTLIGVGGAGARLVGRQSMTSAGWNRWTVDSDVQSGELLPPDRRCQVGSETTRGLGCGGDVFYATELAESSISKLQEISNGNGLVVLVAGVGGGVGGGMTPVIARSARSAGALVVALAIEPFGFEGRLRRRNAEVALSGLEEACDVILRISNQVIAQLEPATASVQDLLAATDRNLADIIDGLEGLLQGSPLIPVGFAELERWARTRKREGIAASASAEGPDRAQVLWSRLVNHPLLESGMRLKEAGGVLLRIAGGTDLRRDELELIQRELETFCPNAQLLVGAGFGPRVQSHIEALIVVVRDRAESTSMALPVRPIRETVPPGDRPLVFSNPQPGTPALGGIQVAGAASNVTQRARAALGSVRKAEQQQFEFAPIWSGRFENVEGTLHEGENLDEPTFLRRGIKLN